jgi:hypothetical protein
MINKARSLIYNSNLPLYLWGEAVLAATYLYNRTPYSSINFKIPYESKYNTKPHISNMRVKVLLLITRTKEILLRN